MHERSTNALIVDCNSWSTQNVELSLRPQASPCPGSARGKGLLSLDHVLCIVNGRIIYEGMMMCKWWGADDLVIVFRLLSSAASWSSLMNVLPHNIVSRRDVHQSSGSKGTSASALIGASSTRRRCRCRSDRGQPLLEVCFRDGVSRDPCRCLLH